MGLPFQDLSGKSSDPQGTTLPPQRLQRLWCPNPAVLGVGKQKSTPGQDSQTPKDVGEGDTTPEISCSPWEQPPSPSGCAAVICRFPSIPVLVAEGVCPSSAVPMETGDRWEKRCAGRWTSSGVGLWEPHEVQQTRYRVLHQGCLWVRATSDRGTSDPQNTLTMLFFIQRSRHKSRTIHQAAGVHLCLEKGCLVFKSFLWVHRGAHQQNLS